MNVLDHGYVNFVEAWGSDESIIEAARMSTNKGFLGWGKDCTHCAYQGYVVHRNVGQVECTYCKGTGKLSGDEKLLKYLYENHHATPFEMGGMVIEVQAPIFIFREWHRHRTQSYNEMSARYTPLPDLNYMPTIERLMVNAGGTNKQAGTIAGAGIMTVEKAEAFRYNVQKVYELDEQIYQQALADGVPKELARIHLPVGRYSRMRASANLRNWLAFLTLRSAPGAQWEIRQYAEAVGQLVAIRFPRTWELFLAGQK